MAMTLVETVTLSSSASSIIIDNIPQTGKDLLILFSGRADSTNPTLNCWFNADTTATNYSVRRLYGDGGTPASETYANSFFGYATISTQTSNTFSNGAIYVSNYTSSVAKSISSDFVQENNATTAEMYLTAGRWSGTAPITKVTLDPAASPNLVSGTVASLYIIS